MTASISYAFSHQKRCPLHQKNAHNIGFHRLQSVEHLMSACLFDLIYLRCSFPRSIGPSTVALVTCWKEPELAFQCETNMTRLGSVQMNNSDF